MKLIKFNITNICVVACKMAYIIKKCFKSDTINASIPTIKTEQDQAILLEIMKTVWEHSRVWIDVNNGTIYEYP